MPDRYITDERGVRWRVTEARVRDTTNLVFTSDRGVQLCGPFDRRLAEMRDSELHAHLESMRTWRMEAFGYDHRK